MKKSTIPNKWSKEETDYLKTSYLHGVSLKIMAAELKRSLSAVNKALSRYNLRTGRKPEGIILPGQQKKTPATPPKSRKDCQVFTALPPEDRRWVTLEEVISWLKTQKIYVIKPATEVFYVVAGYPRKKEWILFHANRLREELGLLPYYVKGITR